jgi:hypothetical protein
MKKIIFLVFFLFVFSQLSFSQGNSELADNSKLVKELKANFNYSVFDADKNYLAWFEYYQSKIFLYNLSEGKTRSISLENGRGPGEYLALTDLKLANNHIYIADPNNNKLLKIDLKTENIEDIPFSTKSAYQFVYDENLYLLENLKPDVLISFFNPSSQESYPLNNDNLDLQEEFNNPFFKDGRLLYSDEIVYFVEKYRPRIYIFDTKKKGIKKKIIFDESDVEMPKPSVSSDGAKAIHPPSKVDILTEDAVLLNSKPKSLFILTRGVSDNREYDLGELHEYDYLDEEFINSFELGVKATNIFANNNFLFVYSEEENAIYQYEIDFFN